jgi:FAD synthase
MCSRHFNCQTLANLFRKSQSQQRRVVQTAAVRRNMSGPDYPEARVLEVPCRVEGVVVKGFGRGSRELNIPTGEVPNSPFPESFRVLAKCLFRETSLELLQIVKVPI